MLAELRSTKDGLTSADEAERLEQTGTNELVSSRRTTLSVLLGQLRSPLLALLLVAACVSIAIGEVASGGIILAIMALSVTLGFVNEYHFSKRFRALTGKPPRTVRRARR